MKGDLEMQLHLFLGGKGGEAHVRERERALARLLEQPAQSHRLLLARLSPKARVVPIAVFNALPRFGRPEAVPALEKLARYGNPEMSLAAARSLGRHPAPAALEALLKLLGSRKAAVAGAAARGLEIRGDGRALPSLLKASQKRDPEIRFYALQAARGLGGLDREALRRLADGDADADIRRWAKAAVTGAAQTESKATARKGKAR